MRFVFELAVLALVLNWFGVFGDSEKARLAGFNDGFAEGYNTTCRIRTTLIEGDWANEHYSKGYHAGRIEGANDCHTDKDNGVVD